MGMGGVVWGRGVCPIPMHIPDAFIPNCAHNSIGPSLKIEYITEEDIQLASKDLGASWHELGQILGFNKTELVKLSQNASSAKVKPTTLLLREWKTLHSQNATFFALLRALEIVQRRDVADNLVTARMRGDGVAV